MLLEINNCHHFFSEVEKLWSCNGWKID